MGIPCPPSLPSFFNALRTPHVMSAHVLLAKPISLKHQDSMWSQFIYLYDRQQERTTSGLHDHLYKPSVQQAWHHPHNSHRICQRMWHPSTLCGGRLMHTWHAVWRMVRWEFHDTSRKCPVNDKLIFLSYGPTKHCIIIHSRTDLERRPYWA